MSESQVHTSDANRKCDVSTKVFDRESLRAFLPADVTAYKALLICACRIEVGEVPSLPQLGYSPASLHTLHNQKYLGSGLHGGESHALQHLREFSMQVSLHNITFGCSAHRGVMLATAFMILWCMYKCTTAQEYLGCRSSLLERPWEELTVGIIQRGVQHKSTQR